MRSATSAPESQQPQRDHGRHNRRRHCASLTALTGSRLFDHACVGRIDSGGLKGCRHQEVREIEVPLSYYE
jgi:hypothetical protein